jgi:hypothetical protein
MEWMAVLVAVAMYLGLRDRTSGGSTHVTILVVTCATLTVALFFRLGK